MALFQRSLSAFSRALAAASRSAMRRLSSVSSFSYWRRRRAFLSGEVIQVAAVGEQDLRFDHGTANGLVCFVGEVPGEFPAADGVDAGFEGGNTIETPLRIGERLRETSNLGLRLAENRGLILLGLRLAENRGLILLFVGFGGKLLEKARYVGLVGGDVVRGQEDRAAGEPCLEGVMGDFGFSFRRSGAGRELGVGAVGGELLFGCHKTFAFRIRGLVKGLELRRPENIELFGL